MLTLFEMAIIRIKQIICDKCGFIAEGDEDLYLEDWSSCDENSEKHYCAMCRIIVGKRK